MTSKVSFQDVLDARKRIAGVAVKTPVLRSAVLDDLAGRPVLIKAECLQRTGSFKFRGAFNRLSLIPEADRAKGVVACSSGNHAQGVAEAARLLGMPATIVMPSDAPRLKLERTKTMGAKVVPYDRNTEDREAIAKGLCAKTGATFVHPFNDPGIVAGQGTAGLELCEFAEENGIKLEGILTGASGGGLCGGVAVAAAEKFPECSLFTVEPEGFDDYARSLASGEYQTNTRTGGSVCDALLSTFPGEIGLGILRERKARGLVVTDTEALAAVAFAFLELKLVTEPGGVVGLAALLQKKLPAEIGPVGVILSGGNIDPAMMAKALSL